MILRCDYGILLALATLGDATHIGLFLFVPHHPRRQRQEVSAKSQRRIADIFAKIFANVNTAFSLG